MWLVFTILMTAFMVGLNFKRPSCFTTNLPSMKVLICSPYVTQSQKGGKSFKSGILLEYLLFDYCLVILEATNKCQINKDGLRSLKVSNITTIRKKTSKGTTTKILWTTRKDSKRNKVQFRLIADFEKLVKFKKPKVERFINPPRYLKGSMDYLVGNKLYKAEQEIVKDHKFRFIDEYLTLRMIGFSGKYQMSKIPQVYLQKYVVITKFLIFNSCLPFRKVDKILLKFLNLYNKTNEHRKVLIVGASLPNLILAKKLDDFGLEVTVIELPRNLTPLEQLIDLGPIMFQLGKSDPFYKELCDQDLQFHKLLDNCVVYDNKSEQYTAQDIKIGEKKFFSIIHELVTQNIDQTSYLRKQFQTKLLKLPNITQRMRMLVNWNLNRFLLVTKLLGEFTEIRTLKRHLDSQFMHEFITSSLLYMLKNRIQFFRDKFKDAKRIVVKQAQIETLEIKNQQIHMYIKKQSKTRTFDYMVYGQSENVINSLKLKEREFKMPEFTGQYLLNSLFVFNKLKYEIHVNTLLQFREKVWPEELKKTSEIVAILNTQLGDVFLIYLESLFNYPSILMIHKKNDKFDQKFERNELNNIVFNMFLLKNKQILAVHRVQSYYIYLRETDYQQRKPVLNPRPRLFFNMPLMTGKYNSKLTSLMANNDFILNTIMSNPKSLKQFTESVYEQQKLEAVVIKKKKPQEIAESEKANQSVLNSLPQIKMDQAFVQDPIRNYEELFGVDHPMVRNHINFLKNEMQSIGYARMLEFCHLLEPENPLSLSETLQIYKFGIPYIFIPNYSFLILENSKPEKRVVEFLNEFVSRRIDQSLFHPGKLTYYYQSVLYVDSLKTLLYIMVDETNPGVVFYHPKLNQLITKIKDKIRQRKTKKKFERLPRSKNINCLFPSIIKKIIENQMKGNISYDQLLDNKLEIIEDIRVKPLFYYSKIEYLQAALYNVINIQKSLRKMKEVQILPLIMGKYDPAIIFLHRYGKDYNSQSNRKIEPKIVESLQSIINDLNIYQGPYKVKLIDDFNLEDFKIKRRFLSLTEPNCEQQIVISHQKKLRQPLLKSKKINPDEYYCVGQDHARKQFENSKLCIQYILQKLIDHYDINYILDYFKKFVIHELSKSKKLPNVLKVMFSMEMQAREFINETEIQVVADKCLESKFSNQQRNQILKALNNDTLDVIQCVFYRSF